jgi:biotin carboxyl carrier protein
LSGDFKKCKLMAHSDPFLVHVGETKTLEVTPEQANALDLIQIDANHYHVIVGGKKYRAELVSVDYTQRAFVIKVNGNTFQLHIADRFERLIKSMGLSVGGGQKMNLIKAPMPGMVLDILVSVGQQLQKGDPLIILEAMKMENMIKSASEATVKRIYVNKGQAVDKGTLLIDFE